MNKYILVVGSKPDSMLPDLKVDEILTANGAAEKAKKYIYALEDFIGAKISSISTSPERDDTILIENPFSLVTDSF